MVRNVEQAQKWYNAALYWFTVIPPIVGPITFFINAPFGRFASSGNSILLVDGIKSWICMELVAPVAFLYSFFKSPLSRTPASSPLTSPENLLAALYVIHYLNRALISPLRTPSRSKSNIIVPAAAMLFNSVNGTLLGTYLSSPAARAFLAGAYGRPSFWVAVGVWAAGLAGNILHDEILLNIRRNAKAKGKGKAGGGEHYAVPHGWLYRYISFPNYFCEWAEWAGYAVAAAPFPTLTSGSLTPPWLFLLSELTLMFPRAWKGHKWYQQRFPDYPKSRKAVLPFLL
ncbi:hypothetical protein PLICRDRAFT_48631 [Plicaturopsis crispa FD-325 SS-3]|nr:hypothetical protein PLICRDRAFT_48631 [Plicaturopsis crispa FD-325 SS-3]